MVIDVSFFFILLTKVGTFFLFFLCISEVIILDIAFKFRTSSITDHDVHIHRGLFSDAPFVVTLKSLHYAILCHKHIKK